MASVNLLSILEMKVITGHINISSIRNKFESLVKYVGNNLDILMVSEINR